MAQPRTGIALDSHRIDRTTRPIDLVHLARQTLGDRALECEVLRMFERQINLYFDRIKSTSDTYEIEIGLHTLKGASRGVGAVGLAQLSQAAEIEFRETGRLDAETLDDLAMAVAEVSAYITGLIGEDA